jgi:hypothetical protein
MCGDKSGSMASHVVKPPGIVGRCRAPAHSCIDTHESCEPAHVESTLRCKHVVEFVTGVVLRPVVGIEEYIDVLSRTLDRVRMCASKHISETEVILTCVQPSVPGPGTPTSSH